jgi:DNA-binding LacI/PurR family transcriptional regulator
MRPFPFVLEKFCLTDKASNCYTSLNTLSITEMSLRSKLVSSRKQTKRRTVSYRYIIEVLRGEISAGKCAPGERLPTHVELQQRFRTTPVTIQRAIHSLARDGFIRTRGGAGLFVAERPPHLHEYALVLPRDPSETHFWSRFYAGLVNVAAALSQSGETRVIPFYGMDAGPKAPDYQRLLARVQSHRLAGIIFATYPFKHIGSPLLEQPGIPRVAIMGEATLPRVNAVAPNGSFAPKAVQYLASRGRRRVAVLTTDMRDTTRNLLPLLAAQGMTTRPFWTTVIHPRAAEGARAFVELLMQASGEERPDGLIVTDDNLVEHAIAGLIAAGVRIGEELDAVVHCNFPWAGTSVVPVKRLGCDAQAVLQTCIQLIERQRRGETVPGVTKLEAIFEDDLLANTRSLAGRQTWSNEVANQA